MSTDNNKTETSSAPCPVRTISKQAEPPKFVRREKPRLNSNSGSTTTTTAGTASEGSTKSYSRAEMISAASQQRRARRQSGGSSAGGGGDEMIRSYDGGDEMTTTDSDERSPTDAPGGGQTSSKTTAGSSGRHGDVTGTTKDYTFMYRKDAVESGSVDGKTAGGGTPGTSPVPAQMTTSSEADDSISSVSTSIVDYVRRSMSETGGTTSFDDPPPPPLPVKTLLHRRRLTDDELTGSGSNLSACSEIISSAWEPTHMTWDEVGYYMILLF